MPLAHPTKLRQANCLIRDGRSIQIGKHPTNTGPAPFRDLRRQVNRVQLLQSANTLSSEKIRFFGSPKKPNGGLKQIPIKTVRCCSSHPRIGQLDVSPSLFLLLLDFMPVKMFATDLIYPRFFHVATRSKREHRKKLVSRFDRLF